jgi:hypothetical protein
VGSLDFTTKMAISLGWWKPRPILKGVEKSASEEMKQGINKTAGA